MRVATVVPVKSVDLVEDDDYKMALAHLTGSREYRQAYASGYVMLDNGVVETGESVDPVRLLDIAERIKANEVVVPDAIGDSQKTIIMAERFITEAARRYSDPSRSEYPRPQPDGRPPRG